MFSYGSGLTSTMFSLRLNNGQHPFSLSNIASVLGVTEKLQSRHEVSPSIHACCSLLIDQCALSIYFDTMLAYFYFLQTDLTREVHWHIEADGAPVRCKGFRDQQGHEPAAAWHILPDPCGLHVPEVLWPEACGGNDRWQSQVLQRLRKWPLMVCRGL